MTFGRNIEKTGIEFACFSFHLGLLFFTDLVFQTGHKKMRILTSYQANVSTLTSFSKEDKILIQNLYEGKDYKQCSAVYNRVSG